MSTGFFEKSVDENAPGPNQDDQEALDQTPTGKVPLLSCEDPSSILCFASIKSDRSFSNSGRSLVRLPR